MKMSFDIVIPRKNESDFIDMAIKLGIEGLIFVYQKANDFKTKKIQVEIGVFVKQKRDPKWLTFSNKGGRHVFEKQKPHVVFGFESEAKKDHTHYKKSGLDDVLCRLAYQNKITIGFSFSDALKKGVMARMKQNIRFCRKYKVNMVLASFAQNPWQMRSPHDLKAWGISMGMKPGEAKAAEFLLKKK